MGWSVGVVGRVVSARGVKPHTGVSGDFFRVGRGFSIREACVINFLGMLVISWLLVKKIAALRKIRCSTSMAG